ncbi:NCX, central ion-binding domain superfamily [Fusarium oxysporum f. sp. vasinfectum]|nr:NCX, central ion-binding domain superfamily [Fusarium oxysporum f. sp. vasinfectum]
MDPSRRESSSTGHQLGDSSGNASPSDTRHPLAQAESAVLREAEGLSESFQSTDTVRRRPEGYGSISGPAASGSAQQSKETSQERSSARATQSSRPSRGPERMRSVTRLRKPPMPRRPSSNTPYRGGVFSADDDVHEVEADAAERQQSYRRRPQLPTQLSRVQSRTNEDDENDDTNDDNGESTESPAEAQADEEETTPVEGQDDSDSDVSEAESFTLKDRQQAINQTHPFGIRVWKPALYKKDRSIQKFAQADIHSAPGGRVSSWLLAFNLLWTLLFGWWLASFAAIGAIVCLLFSAAPSGREYGRVLWGLAGYLFYPFGKFVRLEKDETYMDEDQDEGRSISEYEQWQSGDLEYGRLFFGPDRNRSIVGRSRRSIDSEPSETESLLGRGRRGEPAELPPRIKRRLFGRGQYIREDDGPSSSVLLCTYRAVGTRYWKYTVDGTNIFLINLMVVVVFVIADWIVLEGIFHVEGFITSPAFLFCAGLLSIIPLAYFIGQAVASISAQSSMGVGAAINAFFATVVEVFLYCVALTQGKGQLVEGSIVGSIFAGILFLPGISMCFGAIKRKTQRFNARSAGVTSTMLLFAIVGAFGPTLFYQIYGTHELNCMDCEDYNTGENRDCRRCYFSQAPSLSDRFYLEAVRPYCYMAAAMLFFSYLIGLWFTLRTHAAVIWNAEVEEKRHEEHMHSSSLRTSQVHSHPHTHSQNTAETSSADVRDTQLYKRILGQSLKQSGYTEDLSRQSSTTGQTAPANGSASTPHVVPPKSSGGEQSRSALHVPGLSDADNKILQREVTEIAAAAATIASRERMSRKPSTVPPTHAPGARPSASRQHTHTHAETEGPATEAHQAHGGHDAPNWSRAKSAIILLGATVLYAIIAEILVDTVDVVLESFSIDQKFLGITLFALVPNTTEFLNAISFAMNGNIALSMEIGSAYALQVCLLQIPALVFYSAFWPGVPEGGDPALYTFSLLFPQWDLVTVILCVFLLSYMYGEGKSNYFKGSILMLTYLVVVIGYYFSGYTDDAMGMERFDVMGADGKYQSYKTIGRSTRGMAFPA